MIVTEELCVGKINRESQKTWYNSYVNCYCKQRKVVQLGWKLYGYINILLAPLFLLAALILFPLSLWKGDLPGVSFAVLVVAFITFTYLLGYKSIRNVMQSNKHSDYCSRKVAILGSFYYGIYSEFKIIDKEKN